MSELTDEERSELLSLVDGVIADGGEAKERGGLFDSERVCCGRLPAGPYNIIMTAIVLFFAFLSFNPVQAMQANLYNDAYLSLGILYACLCLFNIVSAGVVKVMGEKWAMLLGGLFFYSWMVNQVLMAQFVVEPLIAANSTAAPMLFDLKAELPPIFKATYFGTSALMGVGGSLLYTAQGSFVALNAPVGRLGVFNGIFFAIYMLNYAVGGLITQFVLDPQNPLFLTIVLTALGGGSAVFLLLLFQPLRIIREAKKNYRFSPLDTLRIFLDKRALLLLPMFLFSGFASTFYYGVLAARPETESGTSLLGYCLLTFGLAEVLASFGAGALGNRIGVFVTFVVGVVLLVAGLYVAFFAQPVRSSMYLVSYALLGAGDGIFNVTEFTALGTFFPKNLQGAFAYLRLLIAFGTAAGFGASLFLVSEAHPIDYFVYLLTGLLAITVVCVAILHRKVAKLDGKGELVEIEE